MPERFYDPDFAARLVRVLNLKGGSAPDLVNTEIQVVLDVSSLLGKATELPGSGLSEAGLTTGAAGILYSGRYSAFAGIAVGQIMVIQVLNPVGSNRRVAVMQIGTEWTTPWITFRRYNTAHGTVQTLGGLVRRGVPSRAPLAEIRRGVLPAAGVPPAGASDTLAMHPAGITGAALNPAVVSAVYLEPGEGLIWYPTNSAPSAETQPVPLDQNGLSGVITLVEFPI